MCKSSVMDNAKEEMEVERDDSRGSRVWCIKIKKEGKPKYIQETWSMRMGYILSFVVYVEHAFQD